MLSHRKRRILLLLKNFIEYNASLKLLAGINGLDPIETLSVSPVTTSDEEVVEDAAAPEDSGVVAVEEEGTTGGPLSPNVIDFSFSVIGTQDAIKELLLRFEHSIRTIDLVTVSFETQQDGRFLVTVTARAYYEPERIVELTDKAVPR